jgi:quinol monooxygenase YgiN
MPEHAQVIRIARYRADPGARDQMLVLMQQLASAMRDLPGLFGAQVCAVDGSPDWLALVSRWRDEASMRDIAGTRAAELTQQLVGLADEEMLEHLVAVG